MNCPSGNSINTLTLLLQYSVTAANTNVGVRYLAHTLADICHICPLRPSRPVENQLGTVFPAVKLGVGSPAGEVTHIKSY